MIKEDKGMMARIKKGIWAPSLLTGVSLLVASEAGAGSGCFFDALGQKLGLSQATASEAVEKEALNVTMKVGGMTCAGCTSKVQSALLKVRGVKSAEVSLEKNQAVVTYEKGRVTVKQLVEAVEKAGFEASAASS